MFGITYTCPAAIYRNAMGVLRNFENRREPRTLADINLTVWGVDTHGERFLQTAQARDISLSGALLTEIEAELRSGDLIGVLYAGKRARFRVVWIRQKGKDEKLQAAIHRLESDACPWQELLEERVPASAPVADSDTEAAK